MCRVLSRAMLCEARVLAGGRCLPAWMMRRESSGRLVRRARSLRRVETVVDWGTVRGKAEVGDVSDGVGWRQGGRGGNALSPARSLTKICMVGSASAEEAREEWEEMLEMLVMLLDRAMLAAMYVGLVR